ncbi:MAG TPA: energy transducer TonB [Lysobacter sp.]
MSTPASAHRPSFHAARWLPARRSLLWVLGAFLLGLALFALVLSGGRDEDALFRADQALPTAASPRYAPLPVPASAERGDNASGMGKAPAGEADDSAERPRLVETAPPAAPPAAPRPADPAAVSAPTRPEPLAGRTPAPRYPSQSLRRGESGTVMVRADIGIDGVPTSVEVADGSGSRYLDRAAVDAVKRWRFRPAMRDGQPEPGTVMVPISFQAQR